MQASAGARYRVVEGGSGKTIARQTASHEAPAARRTGFLWHRRRVHDTAHHDRRVGGAARRHRQPRRAPLQRAAVPLPRRGRGRRQALPLLELGGRGRERVRRCGSTACPWRFDGARANHVPTTHSSRGCIRRPRRHAVRCRVPTPSPRCILSPGSGPSTSRRLWRRERRGARSREITRDCRPPLAEGETGRAPPRRRTRE